MTNNRKFGGMSIYQDEKGRNLYYDIFTKRAYIIGKSDMKTYSLYTASIPLSVVVACLLNVTFSVKPIICVIVGALLFVVCLILFRFLFIYKLPSIDKFEKPKRGNLISSINERMSAPRIIISLLLSIVLIGLVIYNIKINNYNLGTLIACGIVIAISAFINITCIIALIKRNK